MDSCVIMIYIKTYINGLIFCTVVIFIIAIVNGSLGGHDILFFLIIWFLTAGFAVVIKFTGIKKQDVWTILNWKKYYFVIRKWNIVLKISIILIFISYFIYQRNTIYGEKTGVVSIVNDEYVIFNHGQIIRQITKKEYDFVQNRDLRDEARNIFLLGIFLKFAIDFLCMVEEEKLIKAESVGSLPRNAS